MDRIAWILVFLAVCFVLFIVSRLWIGLVDSILGAMKALLGLNRKKDDVRWHHIEDIREKNKDA